MNRFRKFSIIAAITAVAGSAVSATQGISSAESEAGFRLSQFSPQIATLCVATDVEQICTGRVPVGTSRVYNIRYNDPNSFRCHADTDLHGDIDQDPFSRNDWKECKLVTHYNPDPNTRFELVAPPA